MKVWSERVREKIFGERRRRVRREMKRGIDPVSCLPLRPYWTAVGKPNLLSTYRPNYLLLPQIYSAH